jgi:ribonuclease P/MRP protein subunit POP5
LKTVRRRYLAVKIDSVQEIEERELKNAIWNTLGRLFGEYGASKTGFVLISYDTAKNYAVLRCASPMLEAFRASLASLTEISGKPAAIHVLGVSGTLKSLKRKFRPI